MRLLVVIVTYNAMQWAKRCLDSLNSSTFQPDVYIIDNGSYDGTQKFIQDNYPKYFFYQSKENIGFGKANNIGLQYALDNDYDYVYLLNQDAWVMPDTFEKLIQISTQYSTYGILSPFQMNADLKHIDKNFLKSSCAWNSTPTLLTDLYNGSEQDVYEVSFVMAAHWLITRKCLLKIGGFSPSFPHYGEDNNYVDRLHYHGMKIGVVPSLRVVHDRADRIESPQKIIHIIYTTSIRYLSNPLISVKSSLVQIIKANLKGMINHCSKQMLKNLFLLLIKANEIRRNRRISMKRDCAFLVYKKYNVITTIR